MANNRMWLVNERLGKRALLAKYYPSTGWDSSVWAIARLDEMFVFDTEASSFGSTDWKVVYEDAGDHGGEEINRDIFKAGE